MYAKYSYNAGATQANILADVVAILTGTTDKNTLSATCDKPNTEILTTYDPAGWVMHDAAAGTNKVVLKATNVDATTKYAVIDTNSAGYLVIHAAEAWNETTHTGTNVTTIGNTYQQRYSTTLVGVLHISASNRRIIAYGVYSGAEGGATANSWTGVCERVRGTMWWDTVGANYPLCTAITGVSLSGNGAICQTPRARQFTLLTDSTTSTMSTGVGVINYSTQATSQTTPNAKLLTTGGLSAYFVAPLIIWSQSTSEYRIFKFSANCDIWFFMRSYGSVADEVTFNSKQYILITNSSGNSQGSIMVPKG